MYCIYRAHTEATKRNHSMVIVEPRVVFTQDVSKTLVYHIDMAKRTMHEAKYLLVIDSNIYLITNLVFCRWLCRGLFNIMKNTSELKRIEAEKRLVREMEAERMKILIATEKAKLESEDKHDAATKIMSIFRGRQARIYVKQKRSQMILENAIQIEDRCRIAATAIQHNIRGCLTRVQLQAGGFSTPSNKMVETKKKKKRKIMLIKDSNVSDKFSLKTIATVRSQYEQKQRRIIVRQEIFEEIYKTFLFCVQFLDATTKHWISLDDRRVKALEILDKELEKDRIVHFELQKDAGLLSEGLSAQEQKQSPKLIALNVQIKYVFDKIKMNESRKSIVNNKSDWVVMMVRSHLRRKSLIECKLYVKTLIKHYCYIFESMNVSKKEKCLFLIGRFADFLKQMKWLAIESFSIERIIYQMEFRRTTLGSDATTGQGN